MPSACRPGDPGHAASELREQRDVERRARRSADPLHTRDEGVAGAQLVDAQVVEVATPDTAGTLVVPPRCAPSRLGSVPMAMVTLSTKPLAMLPNASNAVTRTGGEILLRTVVLLGCTVKPNAAAGPGSTTTVGVCASGTVPFNVAETVFISALVELSVPVTRPLASVVAAGCVSVFPTPLASNATVAPGTGFPIASSAVTVTVEILEPALAATVAGSAVTRDCVLLGGPMVPVAVNVTGLPVSPVAVAVSVLSPGSSPSVQDVVAIPLALLEVVTGFAVPPPPVTSNRTPTTATGLPN